MTRPTAPAASTVAPAAPHGVPLTAAELAAVRADFPLLQRTVRDGRPLVYLDTAATAQKPACVWEAEQDFYERCNAAVHRGAHQVAEEATEAFESARVQVATFLGVGTDELVWTKNATEALNLVAYAHLNATIDAQRGRGTDRARERFALGEGDEIVITEAEHHANLVPWQELAARTGARLRWISVAPDGRLDPDSFSVITERTRILALTHASNVTGAISPVADVVRHAREATAGNRSPAVVVLDACQSAAHLPLDLTALDVDFAAVSAHKMLGPTGVGALYGRRELLAAMPPVLMGGSMVETVTMETTTYAAPPQRFEAGTQMVAQTVGFAAAVGYLNELGMDRLAAHEAQLTTQLLEGIATVPGVRVLGPTENRDRLAVVAFEVEGIHPHDVGQVLDDDGIAVRVGHHCAQPVHRALGVHSSARASAGVYTSAEDIERFVSGLDRVREFFGGHHG